MDAKCIVFGVADIVFSVCSDWPVQRIRFGARCWHRLCTEDPDVTLYARYDGVPRVHLREEQRVFDSEMVWSLYRTGSRDLFVLKSPAMGQLPYRIAVLDSDYRRGEVFSRAYRPEQFTDGLLPSPLEFPLSEALMVCLLAKGRGLMVHACGIEDEGRGYLFAGNATHGKSTMARLWKDQATILNDDRIVLRWREGRFWMYGIPWYGDCSGVQPQGVPLEKIFFLRHAEANEVQQRESASAVSMLLTRCFPPLWDAEGMGFTLGFCDQLVDNVACYGLGFVPNEAVVDFVRCVT